jgi:NAD(P)-dependent dehydrogenase (short-subunit alcohol dehydrogenase family)
MQAETSLLKSSGLRILVTGGSNGIGLAIVRALHQVGAAVAINARSQQSCASAIDRIDGRSATLHAAPGDALDPDAVKPILEKAIGALGGLDGLIHCAGEDQIPEAAATVAGVATWRAMFDRNALSAVAWAEQTCPELARGAGGAIILLGSCSSLRGNTFYPAYAASKGFFRDLVKHLTVEWGPYRIRANCIAPSLIKTAFTENIWKDNVPEAVLLKGYPLGRLGEPEDVASLAVLLASPAGSWITGQTIYVDGGHSTLIARD